MEMTNQIFEKIKMIQMNLGFCWVIDFPLFEKDEESGKLTFSHNPFAACQPEYMDDLMNEKNLLEIISTQYDVILNGNELGGGSVRAHRPEVLVQNFPNSWIQ
jgi:aspartyl-tRNA synthetase